MIIGKKILRLSEVDSTNDEAKRQILQGEGEGLVIVAESQTKGRGKPGSSWFSPKGNLYFSAIVKPHKNPKELSSITLLTGLAVRGAIYQLTGISATIKWPNDIIISGKKAGGILVERVASGHLVIGIGINVNCESSSFPKELSGSSVSLASASGKTYSLDKLVTILVTGLSEAYLAYLNKI